MAQEIIPLLEDHEVSNANEKAEIVLNGTAKGRVFSIHQVVFGYDGAPSGGLFSISRGATVVFSVPVIAGGMVNLAFPIPIRNLPDETLTFTLAAGGGSVKGYLNLLKE